MTTRSRCVYYMAYLWVLCSIHATTLQDPVYTCLGTSQDGILDPFPYTLLEGFGGFLKYLLMPEYTGIDMEYMVYVIPGGYLKQVLEGY